MYSISNHVNGFSNTSSPKDSVVEYLGHVSSKIDSLSEIIFSLESENEELRNGSDAHAELLSKHDSISSEKIKLEKENEVLRERLSTVGKKFEQNENESEKIRNRNVDLIDEKKSLENELLKNHLLSVSNQISYLEEVINENNHTISVLDNENISLKTQAASITERIQELDNTIQSLTEEIEISTEKLIVSEENNSTLKENISTLESKLISEDGSDRAHEYIELNNKILNKSTEIDALKNQLQQQPTRESLDDMKREITLLEVQRDSLQHTVDDVKTQLLTASESLSVIEGVSNSREKTITKLEDEHSSAQGIMRTLEESISHLEEMIEDNIKIISKLELEIISLRETNNTSDIEDMSTQLNTLRELNNEIADSIPQLQEQQPSLDELRSKITFLEQDAEQVAKITAAERMEHTNRIDQLQIESSELLFDRDLLQQQVDALAGDAAQSGELHDKIESYETEREQLQQQINNLQSENDTLAGEDSDLLSELRSKIKDLEDDAAQKTESDPPTGEDSHLMSELRSQIKDLEEHVAQNAELVDKVESYETERGQLQQQINNLQSENDTLAGEDADLLSELRSKIKELEADTVQNAELVDKVESYETEREQLQQQINNLQSENDTLAGEDSDLLSELRSKIKELEDDAAQNTESDPPTGEDSHLMSELRSQIKDLEEHVAQNAELVDKVESYETERGQLQQQINNLQSENDTLAGEDSDLLSELRSKIKELEADTVQNAELVDKVESYETERGQLQQQINNLQSENDTLAGEDADLLSELRSKIKELEADTVQNAELVDKVESYETEREQLQQQINNLQSENDTLAGEDADLLSELRSKIKELEADTVQNAELVDKVESYETERGQLQQQINNLQSENDTLAGEDADLLSELRSKIKELEADTVQNAELVDKVESYETEREQLQQQINNLQSENDTLAGEDADLLSELRSKIKELEADTVQNAELVDKVESYETERGQLQQQINNLQSENDTLAGEDADLLSELRSKIKELEADTVQNAELVDKVESYETEREQLQQQINNLQSENDTLAGEDADLLSELRSKIKELEADTVQNAELVDKVESYETEREQLQQQINNLQSENDTLAGEDADLLSELRSKIKELEADTVQNAELVDKVESYETEREQLQQQINNLQSENDTLAGEDSDLLSELRSKIKELEDDAAQKTESDPPTGEDSHLMSELRSQIKDLEEHVAQNAELVDKVESYETERGQLQQQINNLQSENDTLAGEDADLLSELRSKIKELEADTVQNAELVDKVESYETEREQLQQQINNLQSENDTLAGEDSDLLSELRSKIKELEDDAAQNTESDPPTGEDSHLMSELRSQIKDLEEHVTNLTTNVTELQTENERLAVEISDNTPDGEAALRKQLREQLMMLKSKMAAPDKTINQLTTVVEELKCENENLKTQLKESDTRTHSLTTQVSELQKTEKLIDDHITQNQLLTNQIDELRSDGLQSQENSELQSEIAVLQKQLNDRNSLIDKLGDSDKEMLFQEIETLTEEVQILKSETNTSPQDVNTKLIIEELQNEVTNLQRELEIQQQEDSQNSDPDRDTLLNQMEVLRNEISELKKQDSDKEVLYQEIETLTEEVQVLKSEINTSPQDDPDRDTLLSQIEVLKNEISELKQDSDKEVLYQEIETLTEEVQVLKSGTDASLRDENNQLKLTIHNLEDSLNDNNVLEQQNNSLQDEIADAEKDLTRVRHSLITVGKKASKQKQQLQRSISLCLHNRNGLTIIWFLLKWLNWVGKRRRAKMSKKPTKSIQRSQPASESKLAKQILILRSRYNSKAPSLVLTCVVFGIRKKYFDMLRKNVLHQHRKVKDLTVSSAAFLLRVFFTKWTNFLKPIPDHTVGNRVINSLKKSHVIQQRKQREATVSLLSENASKQCLLVFFYKWKNITLATTERHPPSRLLLLKYYCSWLAGSKVLQSCKKEITSLKNSIRFCLPSSETSSWADKVELGVGSAIISAKKLNSALCDTIHESLSREVISHCELAAVNVVRISNELIQVKLRTGELEEELLCEKRHNTSVLRNRSQSPSNGRLHEMATVLRGVANELSGSPPSTVRFDLSPRVETIPTTPIPGRKKRTVSKSKAIHTLQPGGSSGSIRGGPSFRAPSKVVQCPSYGQASPKWSLK